MKKIIAVILCISAMAALTSCTPATIFSKISRSSSPIVSLYDECDVCGDTDGTVSEMYYYGENFDLCSDCRDIFEEVRDSSNYYDYY